MPCGSRHHPPTDRAASGACEREDFSSFHPTGIHRGGQGWGCFPVGHFSVGVVLLLHREAGFPAVALVRGRAEVYSAWLKCSVSKCECVVSAWRIPAKGGQRKPPRNGLPTAEEAAGGWRQRMFPWAGGFVSAKAHPVAHPIGTQGSRRFLPISPIHSRTKGGFSSRSNTTP